MRTATSLRLWAAAVLLAAGLTPVFAQTAAPAASQPAATSQATPANGPGNRSFVDSRTAGSQNLAKAEEEDDEYVFKHSSAVRGFGKMLHLSPDGASMAFWALNAIVLFAFIGYFLVTGLPKAFRSRRQELDRAIIQARTATEGAEARLKAVEERLSRLDSEIASVREQAERDSANDEARIRQSLEEEKQKIVASAEQEITSAGAAAERSLRQFAAGLAVDRAKSRLQLSEGDDRMLVQEFATSLGANRPGGKN